MNLELAALPPAALLCLKNAFWGCGLVKTQAGYIAREPYKGEPAVPHSALSVALLMQHGLATSNACDESRVDLTIIGYRMALSVRAETTR